MASRQALRLIKAARGHDAAAQLELGACYLYGREKLAVNWLAALRWLSAAAQNPVYAARATRLIAEAIPPAQFDDWLESNAEVIPEARPESYPWHRQAAQAGSLVAQSLLALHLLRRGEDEANESLQEWARRSLYDAAQRAHPGSRLAWTEYLLRDVTSGWMNKVNDVALEECLGWLEEHVDVVVDADAHSDKQHTISLLARLCWLLGRAELWRKGEEFRPRTPLPDADEAARRASDYRRSALFWHSLAWPQPSRAVPLEALYQRGCLLLWQSATLEGGASPGDQSACEADARRWLQAAAGNGHARASYVLGLCAMGALLVPGLKLSRRYKQANRWLELVSSGKLIALPAADPRAEANYALYHLHSLYNFSAKKADTRRVALGYAAVQGHPLAQHLQAKTLWREAAMSHPSRAVVLEVTALQLWRCAARGEYLMSSTAETARHHYLEHSGAGVAHISRMAWVALARLTAWHPQEGLRLELGIAFGLQLHEFLCLDPYQADYGDWLRVDVRARYGKAIPRWVRIEHAWQRELLEHAQNHLPSAHGASGEYRKHKLRFIRACQKCAVTPETYEARRRTHAARAVSNPG